MPHLAALDKQNGIPLLDLIRHDLVVNRNAVNATLRRYGNTITFPTPSILANGKFFLKVAKRKAASSFTVGRPTSFARKFDIGRECTAVEQIIQDVVIRQRAGTLPTRWLFTAVRHPWASCK